MDYGYDVRTECRKAMDGGVSVEAYLEVAGNPYLWYYTGAKWVGDGEFKAHIQLAPQVCFGGVSIQIFDPGQTQGCQCPWHTEFCKDHKRTSRRLPWFNADGEVATVDSICEGCTAAWKVVMRERYPGGCDNFLPPSMAATRCAKVQTGTIAREPGTVGDGQPANPGDPADFIEQALAANNKFMAQGRRGQDHVA
jgi:hypothetical protein